MKRQIIISLLVMLILPFAAFARNYSATFSNANVESTIAILRKTTGCDFVYQKNLISDVKTKVNGTYTDVSLERLLDETIDRQLGLAYKIVGNTVSLSKAPANKRIVATVSGTVYDEEGEPLPARRWQSTGLPTWSRRTSTANSASTSMRLTPS